MPEELLERSDLPEVIAPEESLVVMRGGAAAEGEAPPHSLVPEGLDTALYEHDERASRADLRRQIAALELMLARLFGSAFPRTGIEFKVSGLGGPRLLSVDELERVRDDLAARFHEVRADLHDYAVVEEANRELLEEMTSDPASHKWVRVYNEDMGGPGCTSWRSEPRWGPLGMLMGWWRVKISSGCPLAEGQPPPKRTDGDEEATPQEAAATDCWPDDAAHGCRRRGSATRSRRQAASGTRRPAPSPLG